MSMDFPLYFALFTLISAIFLQVRALQCPRELSNSFQPKLIDATSPTSSPPETKSTTLATSNYEPLVRVLFVIGDSSVDCGTNNFLGTYARADRLPYGRDFDTHQPTGRFCNGRILVDYLAMRLGLPFVPSYLSQTNSVEDMIHGVNYASAGAGIINSRSSELDLYNANVRKVVVMGLPPIGCAPYYLWQYQSNNGECV